MTFFPRLGVSHVVKALKLPAIRGFTPSKSHCPYELCAPDQSLAVTLVYKVTYISYFCSLFDL